MRWLRWLWPFSALAHAREQITTLRLVIKQQQRKYRDLERLLLVKSTLLDRLEIDLVQARADLQRHVERADARSVPSLHDYIFKDDPFQEDPKLRDDYLTPPDEEGLDVSNGQDQPELRNDARAVTKGPSDSRSLDLEG